jgi:hypothetical protein
MDEIKDRNGKRIPISEVKRVHGLSGMSVSGTFRNNLEDPLHIRFDTTDGEEHESQDYCDQKTAYAELAELKASLGRSGGRA